jgi:hypothetical protein
VAKGRSKRYEANRVAAQLLRAHFGELAPEEIVTSSRTFPAYLQPDLQGALERLDGRAAEVVSQVGLHHALPYKTLEFPDLWVEGREAILVGPLQYTDVDVGDERPVRCLKTALWLLRLEDLPYALLLSPAQRYGQDAGTHVEIAVPAGERGRDVADRYFGDFERALAEARSYRGKVLSLQSDPHYGGMARGVEVHRLAPVAEDQLILPQRTRDLLERNVFQFFARRQAVASLGMSTRKGLLFYGPPGTGKTHTIRHLASRLAGHTFLLVTAEQVGCLSQYFALARLLQPSVVVLEDADLIARDREEMTHPGQEALLNRLLNEMDGLGEVADILFILTTNRPRALEQALVARPGRIDQAIEFPLPDDEARRKLAALYGGLLEVPAALLDDLVTRTAGVSPAFIKELMRRLALCALARSGSSEVTGDDLTRALDEMLFSGGELNTRILGAELPGVR